MSLARDSDYAEGKIYNDDGRSTIPKQVREKLGLSRGDEYVCVMEGDEIRLMAKEDFMRKALDAGISL